MTEYSIDEKTPTTKHCGYALGYNDLGVVIRFQDMRGEQVHLIMDEKEIEEFMKRLNFFLAEHLTHLEHLKIEKEEEGDLHRLYDEAASQVLVDAIKEKGVTEFGSVTVDLSTPGGKVKMATAILET